MKALLYADWCALKSYLVRYLVICLLVAVPVVAMTNQGGGAAAGVAAGGMVTGMLLFYVMLGLFGSDEQGGWEQMRITLPATARTVVRERYAFLALAALGLALVGMLAGIAANVLLTALGKLAVPRGAVEALAASLGSALIVLAYMALVMPYVFKVGISKARIAFSLPLLACIVFTLGPVRDAVLGGLDALEGLARALGSPLPLIAASVAAIALIYFASMRISERIYSARDF